MPLHCALLYLTYCLKHICPQRCQNPVDTIYFAHSFEFIAHIAISLINKTLLIFFKKYVVCVVVTVTSCIRRTVRRMHWMYCIVLYWPIRTSLIIVVCKNKIEDIQYVVVTIRLIIGQAYCLFFMISFGLLAFGITFEFDYNENQNLLCHTLPTVVNTYRSHSHCQGSAGKGNSYCKMHVAMWCCDCALKYLTSFCLNCSAPLKSLSTPKRLGVSYRSPC